MGAGKGTVILIIGKQDTGKTTKAKSLLAVSGKPAHIYDFRNEYGGVRQSFDQFIENANKKKNTFILIEEATVYLSNRGDSMPLKNLLAGRSHDNNTIVIIYHSLRSVPTYIFDLCDYYILFKTNDNKALVESKFKFNETLLQDFANVQGSNDRHFHQVRKLDF